MLFLGGLEGDVGLGEVDCAGSGFDDGGALPLVPSVDSAFAYLRLVFFCICIVLLF